MGSGYDLLDLVPEAVASFAVREDTGSIFPNRRGPPF